MKKFGTKTEQTASGTALLGKDCPVFLIHLPAKAALAGCLEAFSC